MIWLEFSPSPWWRHGRKWNMEPEAQNPKESVRSAADWTGLETDTRFSADRLRGSGHTFRLGVSTSVFTNCSSIEARVVEQSQSEKQLRAFSYSRMVLLSGYIAFNELFYGIISRITTFAFFWTPNVQWDELRRKVSWSDLCEFVRSWDGCSCLSAEERGLHFDWKQRQCSDLK